MLYKKIKRRKFCKVCKGTGRVYSEPSYYGFIKENPVLITCWNCQGRGYK